MEDAEPAPHGAPRVGVALRIHFAICNLQFAIPKSPRSLRFERLPITFSRSFFRISLPQGILDDMDGITTAIVVFIFVCVIYPHLVKNRAQFYGGFAAILLVILIQSIFQMIDAEKTHGVMVGITGLLQIASILLMYMSCGGLSVIDLASDIGKAIEVVRRGGEKETIIVPLRGEQPNQRD